MKRSTVAGKLRWGILSTANIGTAKVIPAMQRGERTEVVAIASRAESRAKTAGGARGIAKAYGWDEALLADPDIDAIYNPLPNHMHVAWSIAAAEQGKHVLCEKPIGLSVAETDALIAARDRTQVKIQEAFMVWTHPQWLLARDLCQSDRIGRLQSYVGAFSYFNADPTNIRNVVAWGGGGLMDIGCYLLVTSRMVFGAEPRRVCALIERDPQTGVDVLASIMLDYPTGQAIGTCGTRMTPYQRVQLIGTTGRVEIEIPFNAPPDRPCRLFVDDGRDIFGGGLETIEVPICDQYTIQGDLFSKAVQEATAVPYPLELTRRNMQIIEALFRSAEHGTWENVEG
jgi:predicted dehydrogenase